MMDEWKGTKVGKVHSCLECKEDRVHLACPIDMVEAHEASFDLCSRVVQSSLQFPNTRIIVQAEKGTCLWSGFLHRLSTFL